MVPQDYEIAFYAQTVWRLAHSSDTNELVAVANVVRNYVVPRLGQVAVYSSFTEACFEFMKVYPLRELPFLTDPAFVSQPEGLLCQITDIYTCAAKDITATHDHPNGARYFARVAHLDPNDWFQLEIVNKQGQHPLLGTFGSMQFFS
jgi:hypothetical protein